MKFPELQIENFLAITEAKVNLADRGLILIQGENHADTSANSNGAGKSSIADALCWVWFGTTARGVTGDDVVNHEAKKNCRVTSVLVDGHMTYTATRHRKHKTGKNSLTIEAYDGLKTIDLTKGTEKLTQEVANQIIGSSLEVFSGSIYAGQEQMPDLPAMTDKHLKLLIEEAAGVTVLEGAYQKAREAMGEAQLALTNERAFVTKINDEIAWREAEVTKIRGMVSIWETKRADAVTQAKTQAGGLVAQLKQLQTDIAAFDPVKISADIAAVDAQIAAVGAENTEFSRLDRLFNQASAQLGNFAHAVATHGALKKRLDDEVAKVKHQIGCPCDSCGRPLTDNELESATKAAEARRDAAVAAEATAEVERQAQEKLVRAAQEARDAFVLSMTDISAASAQRASLLVQKQSYDKLVADQGVVRAQAVAIRDRIAALAAEKNPHAAAIEEHESRLVALRSAKSLAEAKVHAAEERVELEEAVVKVYGPAGVRARVLDDVTPFLNAQTAKYLTTLSDGNIDAEWTTLTKSAKGDLKEKFSIDVTNATGAKIFKGLSGGEKRKVRVATALALQDLVATRATKPIELFIGDEIDDALDPAGLERMTLILEEKAKERGSVFVISHNELRDHIKQVLLIEKMPDLTTKVTEMTA